LATEQVISTEKRVSDMLFPEIDEARERVSEQILAPDRYNIYVGQFGGGN